MTKIINYLPRIDEIARELYDFSKVGAAAFSNVLNRDFRRELVEEIRRNKNKLNTVKREAGQVIQDIDTAYIGEGDNNRRESEFPLAFQLRGEYSPFFKGLAARAGFTPGRLNSVGLHYYPANSRGITAHQDYARDINLVSIFVLEGQAEFYVCNNREGNGSLKLDSSPGGLILLRAARKESEQRFRPFHYIPGVREERYSIIFRQREENGAIPGNALRREEM